MYIRFLKAFSSSPHTLPTSLPSFSSSLELAPKGSREQLVSSPFVQAYLCQTLVRC